MNENMNEIIKRDVDGDIKPDGICKLWIIPEQITQGIAQTMTNENPALTRAQTIESVMKRDELNNVREVRQFALSNVEVREDQSSGIVNFVGYATVFNHDYQVNDQFGSYVERIAPGAFTRTLGESPDVVLNLNHGAGGTGLPVARTKSGTLQLSQDSIGLRVSSTLDPTDPDVQAILPKMRRGDLDEMSMAFRVPVHGQTWADDYADRTITEINLARGDVSIVSFGANPATVAALRAALIEEDTRAALLASQDEAIVPDVEAPGDETETDEVPPVSDDDTERSSVVELLDRLIDARRID
jgi:HK97 family phage prohead protease